MNGRIHGELKDAIDSPDQVIRKRLALLDGTGRYSLSLWRLPEGVPFDRVDLATWPQEYIQAAGSSERMTVEIRRFEDGAPHQYVVGHHEEGSGGRLPAVETAIPWDGYETRVFSNEVFTANEAAELFASYYATGGVPKNQHLRLLTH